MINDNLMKVPRTVCPAQKRQIFKKNVITEEEIEAWIGDIAYTRSHS